MDATRSNRRSSLVGCETGTMVTWTPYSALSRDAVVAAGWTPQVGSIYVPFHVYFIPDVDGVHRAGVTTGVTF